MNSKKIIVSLLIFISALFVTNQAWSQTVKLKATVGSQPLSDEQQGILAVRTIKASVVSIVGVPKPASATSTTGSAPLIVTTPGQGISGSGFIIESDGLIVTNYHVVQDNTLDYTVSLPDGTEYPATIMGGDKFDDVALVKINASNLTPAKLGDSDALETGQSVFVVGNSLGRYEATVTRGVISGLSRALDESGDNTLPTLHNWIQTDAAINLGNSGGPMINLSGEVVGMSTLVDTSGNSLGFAIPINSIKDSVQQLKTFGKVSRPFLGIVFMTVTPKLKLDQGLTVNNGALVVKTSPASPAEGAGLLAGDVITAIDGQTLNSKTELDSVIQKYQSGNQVMLKVVRNGQTLDLPIVLGELK